MRLNRIVIAFVTLVVATSVSILAADSQVGTWKLNIAKSKFSDAAMTPKSGLTKIEAAAGGGIKVTVDNVGADGKAVHYTFTAKYDGKDYPVTGDPNRDMVSYTKKDEYTYESTSKLAGKVTSTATIVYAKDGKTRTITVSGTNAQGVSSKNTQVYDRQ